MGRSPVRYKVYGSDERGFTPSDVPHPVTVARGKQETFPANLIAEVEGTEVQVVGEELDLPKANRAFYRVIAVDPSGIRSGPSDYAEMPRPLIYSSPVEAARQGKTYKYQVNVIKSIGDLRTAVIDGNPYNPAFRDGDALTFVLEEAPHWLSVDEASGVISGCPSAVGKFQVNAKVTRAQGGEDVQRYLLTVSG